MHEPGQPIARGRAADIYDLGDGLVLRRYRTPSFTLYEAAVMRWVGDHGFPVPAVVSASGPDLVMERLDGPTMLADLTRRPWRMPGHIATLAGLLRRLHEIPAPDWLVPRLGTGTAIVHMDLHPDNVMLTRRGPVVIDWTNAGSGDPDAEVADLWLISLCADLPVGPLRRLVLGGARRLLVSRLLARFDRRAVAAQLPTAFEHRSEDRNMRPKELQRMRRLVERRSG